MFAFRQFPVSMADLHGICRVLAILPALAYVRMNRRFSDSMLSDRHSFGKSEQKG